MDVQLIQGCLQKLLKFFFSSYVVTHVAFALGVRSDVILYSTSNRTTLNVFVMIISI